jgi:prepilin-type N-terminal cleavage/methylation domain-containing protein
MKLPRLGSARAGQTGFTLIEMIVVLAITGFIGAAAATAAALVYREGSRNSDYTAASQQAMNAVYWISRDALMAQTVTTNGIDFPLTLVWKGWDSSSNNVTYKIENNALKRSYSINGAAPQETLIAQYINGGSGNTICSFNGTVLTVTITATVGTGTRAVTVTKEGKIAPRPGL